MRHPLLSASSLILALLLAGGAGADRDEDRDHGARAFVGLWVGIDTFDGSTQRLSITCSGRRSCEVRLNDTFFSDCSGGIGFARGDGKIRGRVLSSELTLTCEDTTLSQFNEFVLDPENGTLANLNDSPGLPNVFHPVGR